MPQSQFQKVKEFTGLAGQPVYTVPTQSSAKLTALRLNLIVEELQELYAATLNHKSKYARLLHHLFSVIRDSTAQLQDSDIDHNGQEIPDALSDLLYVIHGAGATFGYDLDMYFDIVHESNMSKFAPSEEAARKTIALYVDGKHPDKRGAVVTGLDFRKVGAERFAIYSVETGKILKYHLYQSVEEILRDRQLTCDKVYLGTD